VSLTAIADSGYYIQWYNNDGAPVNTAPIPPTNVSNIQIYNITQKHDSLHCESDIVTAKVRVNTLPSAVAAIAPDNCPGQYPKIEIEETQSGYIYNVYSESGMPLTTRQSTGDSILFIIPEPLEESVYYLVETINENGCVANDKTTVETKVDNYAYINPDVIPQYERGKQYNFQLETNAVSPYAFTSNNLLYGFTLSSSGLISGIAAVNGLIDSVPFMVKVVDINGCFAEKEYILKSELFVPQLFTPNGDGKNDIFMKGRKLIIFDRLGLQIYEGKDGWDGKKSDGVIAAPDTYFYIIYSETESNKIEKRGYITLISRR
jgi:gliding motility-associated-like protein